ncbi:ribonuclease H-like domain-containing protein [Candidatus Woesearchaeota archaeon]|nr:ribonuclease H-like domain-containing protein [Candidatus Woesearchaeota archaeon]
MIQNSFIFLEKITTAKEKKLWQQGILGWDDFLKARRIKGIAAAAKKYYDRKIAEARRQLYEGNSSYFAGLMPQAEHWRLYEFFREEAVYLDIETDGLSDNNDVTLVGIFDGFDTKTMIRRVNLDWLLLRKELEKYKIVVTFNGSVFDIPFMKKRYGDVIPQLQIGQCPIAHSASGGIVPHYDLRFCCSRIGLKGGLKVIEKKLNIYRNNLIVEGMYGGDAAQLYRMWRGSGDDHYLKLLVEYNEEDTINLKRIAEHVYGELKKMYLQQQPINSSYSE